MERSEESLYVLKLRCFTSFNMTIMDFSEVSINKIILKVLFNDITK